MKGQGREEPQKEKETRGKGNREESTIKPQTVICTAAGFQTSIPRL